MERPDPPAQRQTCQQRRGNTTTACWFGLTWLPAAEPRPLQDGLKVETLISAAPAALHAPLMFERRRIVEMCQVPRSIAEIAVALAIPLGVARVLVADLATDDYVMVQQSSRITIDMLERIIDRVRAL